MSGASWDADLVCNKARDVENLALSNESTVQAGESTLLASKRATAELRRPNEAVVKEGTSDKRRLNKVHDALRGDEARLASLEEFNRKLEPDVVGGGTSGRDGGGV